MIKSAKKQEKVPSLLDLENRFHSNLRDFGKWALGDRRLESERCRTKLRKVWGFFFFFLENLRGFWSIFMGPLPLWILSLLGLLRLFFFLGRESFCQLLAGNLQRSTPFFPLSPVSTFKNFVNVTNLQSIIFLHECYYFQPLFSLSLSQHDM